MSEQVQNDIKSVKKVLDRSLKTRGDLINPFPDTFIMVTRTELEAAQQAFNRIVTILRVKL